MGDIEVIAYELYRENIARVVASSPLIDWSWYTAWPRIRGGASKGDPRVPKPWKDVNDKTGANRRIAVSTRRTSARDCGHPRHRPVRAGARWRLRADLSPHRRRRLHVRGFISRAPAFIGRTGSLRVYTVRAGWLGPRLRHSLLPTNACSTSRRRADRPYITAATADTSTSAPETPSPETSAALTSGGTFAEPSEGAAAS